MRIRLSRGYDIHASPFYFWERPASGILKIETKETFHPCHVTTIMCLEFLSDYLYEQPVGRVLDVGCGCGILALAAARLGAAQVVGVDIDHRAGFRSQQNAVANRLHGRAHWVVGSVQALSAQFDCVLANLPWPILRELWEELGLLLRPKGCMIVSGFQDIHWYAFQSMWQADDFKCSRRMSKDHSFAAVPPSGTYTWLAVALERRV